MSTDEHEFRDPSHKGSSEMASVTVHIPLATLRQLQQKAQSQNRSESDLASEAFERLLRRK